MHEMRYTYSTCREAISAPRVFCIHTQDTLMIRIYHEPILYFDCGLLTSSRPLLSRLETPSSLAVRTPPNHNWPSQPYISMPNKEAYWYFTDLSSTYIIGLSSLFCYEFDVVKVATQASLDGRGFI